MTNGDGKKTQMGLEENIEGALCYLFCFVAGIIFLIVEKDNKFIKFHAIQSIVFSLVYIFVDMFLMIIPLIGWLFAGLLTLGGFVLWIFLMYKAYLGEMYKLPVIGDFAAKQAG